MITNGYFPPLLSEQIEGSVQEFGRPVVYLPSAKNKKEDIAKGFLFVKLQTWFPLHIQVYINGRELKFRLKSNRIKVYDKGNVLRVETTINDPHELNYISGSYTTLPSYESPP